MKTYKEIEGGIRWQDGDTVGVLIEGQTRTRAGAPVTDEDGNETGEFEQETYEPYAELIAAEAAGDVVIEWITDEEKAAAAKIEAIAASVARRDKALQAMTYETANGVIQCRPQDLQNIELGIAQGQTRWKAADNTVITVTADDLQAAKMTGVSQAQAIWDQHLNEVEAL